MIRTLNSSTLSVYIRNIQTLVPPNTYDQKFSRDKMIDWIGDAKSSRLVKKIYDHTEIRSRHSVLPDFLSTEEPVLFEGSSTPIATTAKRNAVFQSHARTMSVSAAQQVVESTKGVNFSDITHIITVSCTGFYNPGPDFDIINQLGLNRAVQRYNLGFMGCNAAFPALRMASQFCKADEDALVLIVCIELCSLHVQVDRSKDRMLANALFSDGVAAVLVSAKSPSTGEASLEMVSFSSALLDEGQDDMAWTIGDQGFDLKLSSYVPKIIGSKIKDLISKKLNVLGCHEDKIDHWAIHPGGRSIIDKICKELTLDESQVKESREVLRDYGNMSSATILFVLRKLLDSRTTEESKVCSLVFGPGLTVDTILMNLIPSS